MKEYDQELAARVLTHCRRPNYRPVKPSIISKQLDLSDEEYNRLRIVIKKLVQGGELRFGPKHMVLLPLAERKAEPGGGAKPLHPTLAGKRVEGVFRRAMAGYGFVRPTGTPAGAGRADDIFIPRQKSGDASSGDTVLVRVRERREGDKVKREGEIVEIIARDTHRFVGTYSQREGEGYVQVDGTVFSRPILVGDPGAKRVKVGDKVVVELIRFPGQHEEGEGVIVEVLGARGQPGVDTLCILREYGLPEQFSEDVLATAREEAARWNDEEVPHGRTDLTNSCVITIDPIDARDFDDAISLERQENGHWTLGVHIADVTHFVRAQTPLDREARERATSVYLPDQVIPMLPELISNNLASLQPDKLRYTKTVFISFTAEGIRTHVEPHSAAIRSQRRFTYEEVDEYLAQPNEWKKKLTPAVHSLLGRMHTLAMILRKRRLNRGAIELTLPEVKIDLNDEGRVSGAHLAANTVSHQIIEEFMLAANEAVAEYFRDREVPFLRRIHESPDLRKLDTLTAFVRELGLPAENLQSRFEIKKVIEEVKDRPEQHAVNYAVLRSMQKAVYSPIDEGHFALASDCYCHFTSPIRRYPDLTVHRALDAILRGRRAGADDNELMVLGQHCSEREQRAASAERDLVKLKLLNYLSTRLGEEMDALITGVEDFGFFCQGVKLPAEGLVHIDTFDDDYYYHDADSHSLTGRRSGRRYRLGDVVRVRVQHVDLDRRELDFRLVEKVSSPAPLDERPKKYPKRAHEVGKRKPPKKKPTLQPPKKKKRRR